MAGYWQRPDETAKVMTSDGFFKSGDIGIMDERGHTRIVDRKKDMIIVSGFNVFPNEIEGVLALHPGVLECAVIGVPDERAGEAVKAFVVRKDPALTEADLVEYCRQHLAGYKKPKTIEFRDDLPRSNIGKILRRALREPSATEAARRGGVMGIAIPMLDLMFFLTENQDNPRHVGAMLIFQRPRRGGARVLDQIVEAYRQATPVPPFNRIPVLQGRPPRVARGR